MVTGHISVWRFLVRAPMWWEIIMVNKNVDFGYPRLNFQILRVNLGTRKIQWKVNNFKKVSNCNTSEIERWVYYACWKFDIYRSVSCSWRAKIVASLLFGHFELFAYIIQYFLAKKVRRLTILEKRSTNLENSRCHTGRKKLWLRNKTAHHS